MVRDILSTETDSDLLKTLLDAAPEAIVVAGADGRIILFNTGAENLFGYTAEQARGQDVSMLMSDRDSASHGDYMDRYMGTGEKRIIGIGREVIGRNSAGEDFPLHLSVGDASRGDDRMFVAIMHDLTQRTQLQAELRDERAHASELERTLANVHRSSTLGEMTAGIAHEINQPLAAMSSYADAGKRLISQESPDLDKISYAFNQIAEQARRAGGVVERIRALSRQQETPRELNCINEVISALMALLEMEARQSGAPIDLKLADNLPKLYLDAIQIQQVLLNLARNGLEAMVRPSQISRGLRIETQRVGEDIHVAVTDHGTGVELDQRERIFEPFQTSKPSGMGVGLSICRTIVRGHGGRLWCEENPEGGSCFVMALPISKVEE